MPAINPPQGAGHGFGQLWCHYTSHQLLGMGGGSRAAAQSLWGAVRVPQHQSTLKPEQAAPHARSLWAGATPLSSPPSLVHGGLVLAVPWAGAAVGLALAGEPLCLGAGVWEGRGVSASSSPPPHLAAAGTVASACAAMSPSPTATPMVLLVPLAGPGCPCQPGSIAACTPPSGSCRFLGRGGTGGHSQTSPLRVLGCRIWPFSL